MFVKNIILLTVFVYTVSCESCLRRDGEKGTCVKLRECPSGIALLLKGDIPNLCYQTTEPIVCCDDSFTIKNDSFPFGCKQTWKRNRKLSEKHNGGIDFLAREFPHVAALGYKGEDNKTVWGCGGTLVTTEFVLTAAHCLHSENTGDLKYVRLGHLNINSDDDAESQTFKVIDRKHHRKYQPPTIYNDLAIIKLDRPAKINPYVIPACLNTEKELPSGHYSTIASGQLGYGEELTNNLQDMIIKIYNHTVCQNMYSRISTSRLSEGIDEKTQICAGNNRIDTCSGDSGGPLQLHRSSDNTVYGVTSFGVACFNSHSPGVYINVSPYIPWIKSIIQPEIISKLFTHSK